MKSFSKIFYHPFFKELISILILIILPLLLFNKALFANQVITLGDFSGSDYLDLHLPFKQILHETIPKGIIPLWDHRLTLGFPVLAEGQSGVFYPPNILLSFFPPTIALSFTTILTLIITGLTLYIYARSLKLNRFPSLLAAITFAFSAFFVARFKHANMVAVAAWVPLFFYSIHKLATTFKLKFAALAGIILAIQLLAGHPNMTFYAFAIYVIYILFEFYLQKKSRPLSEIIPFLSISIFIIGAISFGLSAVQLLPTLELTQLTQRASYTFAASTAYPFHPKNLITFISPYYFGNPATGSYSQNIQTFGIFWENATYIGLLPFILAIIALIRSIKNESLRKLKLFLIFLILFSLALMLGRQLPLFRAVWNLIPGFQLFRFPTRFNLFIILSLSLLAGLGAEKLVTKLENIRIQPKKKSDDQDEFTFSWPLKNWQTQALIIGFIVVDLFVFASSYIGYLPADKFHQTPEIAEKIQDDKHDYRIYNLTQYNQSPYSVTGWKNNQDQILAIRKTIAPNNNLLYGLSSFSDRGWFEGGLGTQRRNDLENFILKENQDAIILGKILGTFNVKYIVTFAQEVGIEIELLEDYDLGEAFASKLGLFENKQVLPRAYIVPEAKLVNSADEAFEALKNIQVLPTKTVILEDSPNKIPAEFSGILNEFHEQNTATISSQSSTDLNLDTQVNQHSFLVLSDLNYPGWKATVDDQPTPILRANYLVRALELEPGEHKVRFYYDPLPFKAGAIISASTLTILTLSTLIFITAKLLKKPIVKLKKR
jgi:hypothetical protein